MITYRPVTDLTDEEVTDIIRRLFSPISIESIDRRDTSSEVSIVVRFRDEYTDLCKVRLYDPFEDEDIGIISGDYEISWQRRDLYKRYCLAKGVCIYLKDNPFIQEE